MAQLTITGTVTMELDGISTSQTATFVSDVRSFLQGTKDLTNTYSTLSADASYSFVLIENVGEDPVVVRTLTIGGDYLFVGIAPGGHVLIPGRHGTEAAGLVIGSTLAARSVTSAGSRIVVGIGTNSSQE